MGECAVNYPLASIFSDINLLPLLVFVAETCVLTLATLRTITIARGKKLPAAALGFFEVGIWLFAVGQVMQNLSDIRCAGAFAAGFALGNYLGVLIEQKLAIGTLTVQITTRRDAKPLVDNLHSAGFGVTKQHGEGMTGRVEIVTTVVKRRSLPDVSRLIESFDTGAFYAVHDLQSTAEGNRPVAERSIVPAGLLGLLRAPVSKLSHN